jgi:altronate hydrolase
MLQPNDSVAVCLRRVLPGERFCLHGQSVEIQQEVDAGHKIAIREHALGQSVVKFGFPIGVASVPIRKGQHVHSHNLMMDTRGLDEQAAWHPPELPVFEQPATFEGFVRPGGQVGTRNYVAVISNVNCSASVARMIARHFEGDALDRFPNVDGVISFRHESGCGMSWQGFRHRTLARVLAGIARHPNIGGCLLVGLGCEQGTLEDLVSRHELHQIHLPAKPSHAVSASPPSDRCSQQSSEQSGPRPIPMLSIQDSGGTRQTIQRGVEMVRQLLPEVNAASRSTVSASHLILATECGGSDGYSGITANPVLGVAADLLVACGGTVILSETPEIFGAEHLLTGRARCAEVSAKLLEKIRWWQAHCAHYGEELDHNPSVGNKAGGLTTITEKSLGAVAKAGSTRLEAVVDYAEPIRQKGLVFMDSPGFDPASVTGMVAGGANLVAFTTGRGSCFGFKPAPSLKIASHSELYHRMSEDMDFDAGCVLDGRSVAEVGHELFLALLEAASGKQTCSERLGIGDEEFIPWLVGPML